MILSDTVTIVQMDAFLPRDVVSLTTSRFEDVENSLPEYESNRMYSAGGKYLLPHSLFVHFQKYWLLCKLHPTAFVRQLHLSISFLSSPLAGYAPARLCFFCLLGVLYPSLIENYTLCFFLFQSLFFLCLSFPLLTSASYQPSNITVSGES